MKEIIERPFERLPEEHDRAFLKSIGRAAERALREQEFARQFHETATGIVGPVLARQGQVP